MQKYELIDEPYSFNGHTIRRIRALRDFGNVKAGDLGGWLEFEDNLSHDGDCWVADNAKVMDSAQVKDNAIVRGNAKIEDQAQVYGCAIVEEYAEVKGKAGVFVHAKVGGYALIVGWTEIGHHACVEGHSFITGGIIGGYAMIDGHVMIGDYMRAGSYPMISGHAHICENAKVRDRARINGNAVIGSNVVINSEMFITDNAYLFEQRDLLYLPDVSSAQERMTFYRCKDDTIQMTCSDFHGTGEEFWAKVAEMSRDERDMQEYRLAFELAKTHIRCEPLPSEDEKG